MKLIRRIKHTFWPGFNNSFHPYAIRVPALAAAASCVLLFQVVVYIDGQTGDTLGIARDISEEKIVEETNQKRQKSGEAPLRLNRRLSRAAEEKARHMVTRDYWSHYGPAGSTPWSFIEDAEYTYQHAGENLAKNFQTSSGVISGWMNSPQHRDNMLDSRYQDIGVAAVDGYLEGERTTVVVAMYATPTSSTTFASAQGSSNENMVLPSVRTYSAIRPLNVLDTLPPAAQFGAAVALMLGIVYVGQHVVIRRQHLLWDKHVHPRPMLQAALLVGVVVVLIHTSYGAVG